MKISSLSFTHNPNTTSTKPADKPAKKISDYSVNEKIYAGISAAGIAGLTILTAAQRKKISALKALSQKNMMNPVKELLPYKIEPLAQNKVYQKFLQSDGGIINFLKNTKEDAGSIKSFLFSITADNNVSDDFIKEVTANPRHSVENLKILNEKIGGEKNLLEWLQAPKGYNNAYNNYLTSIIALAEKPEDFIKISPNWHLYILKNCCQQTTAQNLSFGKLPQEFKELGDFSHFAKWINEQPYTPHEPKILEYSGKYMYVTRLNHGASGKIPFKIQFVSQNGESSKPYVLKVQQSWGCDSPYAKEALSYRSDSAFVDAQLDYYLTAHKCQNSPKFHFFDFESNSGLYEFQEGNRVEKMNNVLSANQRLKDMNSLGIFYNDACECNFVEKDGVLKVIDIGEASFIDPLRPGGIGCTYKTPNWCGTTLPNLSMMLRD